MLHCMLLFKLIFISLVTGKTIWTQNERENEDRTISSSEGSINADVVQLLNTIVDVISESQKYDVNKLQNNMDMSNNAKFEDKYVPSNSLYKIINDSSLVENRVWSPNMEKTEDGGNGKTQVFSLKATVQPKKDDDFLKNEKKIEYISKFLRPENIKSNLRFGNEKVITFENKYNQNNVPEFENTKLKNKNKSLNPKIIKDLSALLQPYGHKQTVQNQQIINNIIEEFSLNKSKKQPNSKLNNTILEEGNSIVLPGIDTLQPESIVLTDMGTLPPESIILPGIGTLQPESFQIYTLKPGGSIDLDKLQKIITNSWQSQMSTTQSPEYWRHWRENMLLNRPMDVENNNLNETLNNFIQDLKTCKLGVYNLI